MKLSRMKRLLILLSVPFSMMSVATFGQEDATSVRLEIMQAETQPTIAVSQCVADVTAWDADIQRWSARYNAWKKQNPDAVSGSPATPAEELSTLPLLRRRSELRACVQVVGQSPWRKKNLALYRDWVTSQEELLIDYTDEVLTRAIASMSDDSARDFISRVK